MFDAHVFTASSVPDPYQIHCLVAHLTDKVDLPLKVDRRERVLTVLVPANFCVGRTVALDTIAFTFRRTERVGTWCVRPGEIATISTRLCYTVHRRNERGKLSKKSPFDGLGHLLPGMREHFLRYLETRTGLTGLVERPRMVRITVADSPALYMRQRKVWLNGVVDLSVRARVADAKTFNRLAGVAIGNRRSYGFGAVYRDAVECDPYERVLPENELGELVEGSS